MLSPHLSRCSVQPLLGGLLSGLERLPCTAGQPASGTIKGTARVHKYLASGLHRATGMHEKNLFSQMTLPSTRTQTNARESPLLRSRQQANSS